MEKEEVYLFSIPRQEYWRTEGNGTTPNIEEAWLYDLRYAESVYIRFKDDIKIIRKGDISDTSRL